MADMTRDDDGDEIGQLLRDGLPRHPAPAALRAAVLRALLPEPPRRGSTWWLAPALTAATTAMVAALVLLPALPASAPPDPLRPITRAALGEHARAILWGESRPDVVPAILPRAMEESGVLLSWVFTGDESLRLVNAQPTYLEGRRGIQLAYQDADGHAVTYLILPLGQLALPEHGRVQVDRYRPLSRQENGFSVFLWRQQSMLCVLIADLVSEQDFGRFKDYFVKLRTSTEPVY